MKKDLWCGWCKTYIVRETSQEHFAMHARRLERSAGPMTPESEEEE